MFNFQTKNYGVKTVIFRILIISFGFFGGHQPTFSETYEPAVGTGVGTISSTRSNNNSP